MVISSSTGDASSGSSTLKASSSEEDIQQMRKRKRMVSNRESAQRSRMKKQKHLDELTCELSNLRKENNEIVTDLNLTSQLYFAIEAENSILRAQISELSLRLDALNDIINRQESTNTPQAVVPPVSSLYPCFLDDGLLVNSDWNFNFQGINQQHPMIDMAMY